MLNSDLVLWGLRRQSLTNRGTGAEMTLILLTAVLGIPSDGSGQPHAAEHQVLKLIHELASATPQAAADKLIALGDPAVPYIIRHMNDRRPMKIRQLQIANKQPGNFEFFRQRSPEQVIDACSEILNQITGIHFKFIGNGEIRIGDRDEEVQAWRKWIKAQKGIHPDQEKRVADGLRRLGVNVVLSYGCVRNVVLSRVDAMLFSQTVEVLTNASRLESLYIKDSQLTDETIAPLKDLSTLEWLRLDRVPVADGFLVHLRGLVNLEYLDVRETKVTEIGARQLLRSLPKLRVVRYGEGIRDAWERSTQKGHLNAIQCLRFSPDGKQIVSADHDGAILIWDSHTKSQVGSLSGHECGVNGIAFSADNRRLISGGQDGSVKIWQLATGRVLLNVPGDGSPVMGVAFNPDGRLCATVKRSGAVIVCESRSGRETHRLNGGVGFIGAGDVQFSSNGELIAATDEEGFRIWQFRTGGVAHRPNRDYGSAEHISFSPDGRWIASWSRDWRVRIWDSETGNEVRTLEHEVWPATFVAFTSDGKRVLSGNSECLIQIWDATTGRLIMHDLQGPSNSSSCVGLSPDGRRLACAKDHSIAVMEVPARKQ